MYPTYLNEAHVKEGRDYILKQIFSRTLKPKHCNFAAGIIDFWQR